MYLLSQTEEGEHAMLPMLVHQTLAQGPMAIDAAIFTRFPQWHFSQLNLSLSMSSPLIGAYYISCHSWTTNMAIDLPTEGVDIKFRVYFTWATAASVPAVLSSCSSNI